MLQLLLGISNNKEDHCRLHELALPATLSRLSSEQNYSQTLRENNPGGRSNTTHRSGSLARSPHTRDQGASQACERHCLRQSRYVYKDILTRPLRIDTTRTMPLRVYNKKRFPSRRSFSCEHYNGSRAFAFRVRNPPA